MGVGAVPYERGTPVGAARFARPRFLDGVRRGVDWRGVGWFQALEDAFTRAPEGVHKAAFEPELQERRATVLSNRVLVLGGGQRRRC